MKTFRNLINGELVGTGPRIDVVNPATGALAGRVHACRAQDARAALEAAQRAFPVYSALSIDQRADRIRAFRTLLGRNRASILRVLTDETGKTAEGAAYDFGMLLECLDFFAEAVKRHYGTSIPDYGGTHDNRLIHHPVGVVAAFLAWNFPLLNLGYKLGPILAAGNTCVIKPSIQTPLATALVGELFNRLDFPPGTLNVVCGSGRELGPVLSGSRIPRLLTLIGSTEAGLELIRESATSVKRYSLELGGNAPVLVFDDADVRDAARQTVALKFVNAGQVCVSPNRVYVHERVYEAFLREALRLCRQYRLGSGAARGRVLQPLIGEHALGRMIELIRDAEERGATVLHGGRRARRKGFFLQPTLIRDAAAHMRVFKEEIFGPILPVAPFSARTDVFRLANATPAGLSAYVFTRRLDRAMEAQDRLEFGNILINTVHYSVQLPHGGMKQSGLGKDISHLALEDMYEVKRVSVRRGAG
ncbi:MAG: aldehyde dehydrogenase family protein [Kiritimatiellae bacterium]|nr:aldehyde dehydrogenase family protein [Kiritimatiellia bacterium]